MLTDAALGFINHILDSESWARNRLKAFAGQVARLELGKRTIHICITSAGYVQPTRRQSIPTVTLTLPEDSFFQSLTHPSTIKSSAQISGSAQLAECLVSVFSNLHWDVEGDLSPLLGDIAARRFVRASTWFLNLQLEQAQNLVRNLAEYLTDESPSLPRRREFSLLSSEAEQAQDHLARLAVRITNLET